MEHKILSTPRGRVHYWVKAKQSKDCFTLVFTHGLTADHTMFEKQIAYFSDRFNILTWDVPLHGLSRDYQEFSFQHCAQDLFKIIQQEQLSNIVLIGMSMGGYPSQEFACQYPERVKGFVAIDTTPYGTAYYSKTDLWWLKQVAPMANWFWESALKESMAQSVSRTHYARNKMRAMLAPFSKKEIVSQLHAAYSQFPVENKDVTFAFPVLILLGEYDKTGKVKQYCKEWAKKTGYPLKVIKQAAHFSNGDNPNQVHIEITHFLNQLEQQ